MPFVFLMLLAVIPAVMVLWVGLIVIPAREVDSSKRSWVLFLLIATIVLLVPAVVLASEVQTGGIGFFPVLLWPALEGLLALLLLEWREVHARWQEQKVRFSLLLLALFTLIALTALGQPLYILAVVAPALFLAGSWAVLVRVKADVLMFAAGVVLIFQVLQAVGLLGGRLFGVSGWVEFVWSLAGVLSVVASLILPAILIYRANNPAKPVDRSDRIVYICLSILLVLGLALVVFRHGVMVNATAHGAEDHMPFGQVAFAVTTGMLLIAAVEQRSRFVGFVFMISVPVLMAAFYSAGFLIDTQAVTTARAERIKQAIEQYHQENGAYPSDLEALTPEYTPFILGPLSGHRQVWCYQGGSDYYRLGYVFIQRYYEATLNRPFMEIRIQASAGEPPDENWMCDEQLLRARATRGL